MNALTVITTSGAANLARRRSSSAPPIRARIVICLGTSQTPLRLSPLRIAKWLSRSGPGTTSGEADGCRAGTGRWWGWLGRSRVIGTRSA